MKAVEYKHGLYESLKDPREAAAYLEAHLTDMVCDGQVLDDERVTSLNDREALRLAIRDICHVYKISDVLA